MEWSIVFLIVACILFLLAGVPPSPPYQAHLIAWGLFFFALFFVPWAKVF